MTRIGGPVINTMIVKNGNNPAGVNTNRDQQSADKKTSPVGVNINNDYMGAGNNANPVGVNINNDYLGVGKGSNPLGVNINNDYMKPPNTAGAFVKGLGADTFEKAPQTAFSSLMSTGFGLPAAPGSGAGAGAKSPGDLIAGDAQKGGPNRGPGGGGLSVGKDVDPLDDKQIDKWQKEQNAIDQTKKDSEKELDEKLEKEREWLNNLVNGVIDPPPPPPAPDKGQGSGDRTTGPEVPRDDVKPTIGAIGNGPTIIPAEDGTQTSENGKLPTNPLLRPVEATTQSERMAPSLPGDSPDSTPAEQLIR